MFDGKAFGSEIVGVVKSYVGRVIEPILVRIDKLEVTASAIPQPGPAGKDGKDGLDGKDAPPVGREDILAAIRADPSIVSEAVATYLEANPPPAGKDGRDGLDGKDGPRGADGKDAVATADEIAAAIRAEPSIMSEAVATYMKANPPPAGKDGRDGLDGKDGAPGADGKDGVGVAGAIIDRAGNLTVTLSDGSLRALGTVIGKDGRDGVDGKDGCPGRDGFTLSDFSAEILPDKRTVRLAFESADGSRKTFDLPVPAMIYRGVWREGEAYRAGDVVTFGGSLWHCDADAQDKPGDTKAWTLAAKRGRDGKDGAPGERGPEGRPGRDLARMPLGEGGR